MYKYILALCFFLLSQICEAQNAVVALPAMNVVYTGLDNPVEIAVEGYTSNQISVSAELFSNNNIKILPEGSFISHVNGQKYNLRVTNTGKCLVKVSYKKNDTLKTETYEFRVKSVPRPESMFGEIESGSARASDLINQNTINGTLPNFVFKGIEFTVTDYNMLYVPKKGMAYSLESSTCQIPAEVKRIITKSKTGDKILIDDIGAVGAGGIKKRLAPIAITILNPQPEITQLPDYFTHQKVGISLVNELEINEVYTIDRNYNIKPGMLKGYRIVEEDTLLILEVKKTENKILWEKHYYLSGKLMTEYNFENNDTTGTCRSFYQNGKIKSTGKIIVRNEAIIESYRTCQSDNRRQDCINLNLTDSFLYQNYAPYGKWKGYYETGALALECSLSLYKYGHFPLKEGDKEFDLTENNPNKTVTSIRETLTCSNCYCKPWFSGPVKLFNRDGHPVSKQNR